MKRILLALCTSFILTVTSVSFCFANELSSSEDTELDNLLTLYENQSNSTYQVGANTVEKVDLDSSDDIIIEGINSQQKENTDVYTIENEDESSKTCVFSIPVDDEDSNSVIAPCGDKGHTKNYARIEAYVKIYYSTLKNKGGEMGYKPTKVGGKIKYLPNSAAIKSLKTRALTTGSYHTSALKNKFQSDTVYSTLRTLDVNKFSKLQTVNINAPDRYFHCDVDGTEVAGRYYVSYTLNNGKNSGKFTVQVNI